MFAAYHLGPPLSAATTMHARGVALLQCSRNPGVHWAMHAHVCQSCVISLTRVKRCVEGAHGQVILVMERASMRKSTAAVVL
jgi:hypothetical protein